MNDQQTDLNAKVAERAVNGRLTCVQAMQLANELNVAPLAVGKAADAAGVKVIACQLGCFGVEKK